MIGRDDPSTQTPRRSRRASARARRRGLALALLALAVMLVVGALTPPWAARPEEAAMGRGSGVAGSGEPRDAGGAGPAPERPTNRVVVDVSAASRSVDRAMVGANTNFLFDAAARRAAGRGLEGGLRRLGVGALRYPGGEKADATLWSVPPFDRPHPTPARRGPAEWPSNDPALMAPTGEFSPAALDFDQFMTLCRALGAEPTLVVAFDSMYKPAAPGGVAPTRQQLLDTVVAWVRYANLVKGYGVTYWEIGNESYQASYAGGATAADYARGLIDFARAMKAVDPAIKIGANGPPSKDGRGDLDASGAWWETVLTLAAPEIDFLAVHAYPVWAWRGYEDYRDREPALTDAVDGAAAALDAWAPEHAERIRIRVTETSAADWSPGGWTGANDLGHALVLAEIVGAQLAHPKVDAVLVWNTRWAVEGAPRLWSLLDEANEPLASGLALAAWGQFLQPRLLPAAGSPPVRAFASHDPASGRLTVILINKGAEPRPVTVAIAGYADAAGGALWSLRGAGPDDAAPAWGQVADLNLAGGELTIELPPVSLSVVTLAPTA